MLATCTGSEADYADFAERFVRGVRAMHEDGWWWSLGTATNKTIRRRILREMLAHRF